MTKSVSLLSACTIAHGIVDGECAWCGADLPARRRMWCTDKCSDTFWANHWWSVARRTAKRRDKYKCKQCGKAAPKRPSRVSIPSESKFKTAMRDYRKARKTERLEVNHIIQARGQHRALSCIHHLDNLETLCSDCHKAHTAALPRRGRAAARKKTKASKNDRE